MLEGYKDVLTVDDVKDILGIGKNKAYELVRSGKIESLEIGKKYRIPKVFLINYINNGIRKCYGSNVDEMAICE